ncbi:MAG: hypothetical protein ABJB98_01785 [Actinomycetota bacterium]
MQRSRIRLAALVSSLLLVPIAAYTPAAASTTPPQDDTPVQLSVKGDRDNDSDEEGLQKLRDDYYLTDRLAGETGALSIEQAATLRVQGAKQAAALPTADQPGASRGGAWQSQGPDPTVQIGRTTNTLQAVSGRVGALAVRPDGTILLGAAQGGVWTYDAVAQTWTSRTQDADTQSVGALGVAPSNPNIVYLGTGEGALSGDSYYGDGVHRSTDGGLTWTKVSADRFLGVSISDIVIDSANANHLFISTLRGRAGVRRTTAPPSAAFGVWESADGGLTWTLRKGTTNEFRGATDLVMDPQNSQLLWASFWGDGIYRSTDGGLNWTNVTVGLPAGNFAASATRFSLGVSHPAGAGQATLYTGYTYVGLDGVNHPAQVYKSTDGGAIWAAMPTGSGSDSILGYCGTQCQYDNEIKPDPNDPNTVYVEGSYGYGLSPQSGGIYRSKDGGQTWLSLGYDLHPDFHAVAFQPGNPQHVVIGNDGGVWQSSTGGGRNVAGDPLRATDWVNLNGQVSSAGRLLHSTGLRIGQFVSIATVPKIPGQYWGGTQDNGTQRKSVLNTRWFDQPSGDGGQVIVDQTTPNTINPAVPAYVFGTYFGISPYRFGPSTANAFNGNTIITNGINLRDRAEFYIPWIQNRANVNQMFLGTYRLYRTNNAEAPSAGDVSWQPISGDLTSGCTGTPANGARGCLISAVGMADGGDGVYVGTDDGYLSVSSDAATSASPTWTRVGQNSLPNLPVSQIAVDKSNWRIAYVAYSGFGSAHVFRTMDGGAHWDNITASLPNVPVNSIVLDPSAARTLYVGTDVGTFVSVSDGSSWKQLGTNMPKVASWQLDYDPTNGILAAGTHGRGVYTLANRSASPALVVSKTDSGVPVGPGRDINYTITVRNIGNADATGVSITDPLPKYTSFVSASNGGTLSDGKVAWTGLTVLAGGSTSVTFTVRIVSTLPALTTSIVNDGIAVHSDQGASTSGSPHSTPIAPAFSVTAAPPSQTGAARAGQSASYTVSLTNKGYTPDSYSMTATGLWPATVYDATCVTPLAATPTVQPGSSTDVCVKVAVPAAAVNGETDTATLSATSVGSPSVSASATLTTIAVTADVLLVDGDGNAPDVKSYYTAALGSTPYSYWDLAAHPNIPQSLLTAHTKVVWWTGNSYPGPISPHESELSAFLSGGGRLFLSGQDILDQAAGTTAFVRDYLHVNWDGTDRQNDLATATVTATSNPVTAGLGTVPIDHSVLGGAPFEDQITPIPPGLAAFTDGTGQPDALTVADGSYKVAFLAFPFEEFGTAANKADLMSRVLTYFSS